MNTATLPFDDRPAGIPRLSVPLVVSLAIHVCLLFIAAMVFRAMPPAAKGADQPATVATLLALPTVKLVVPVPIELMSRGEPMQSMLPIPVPPAAEPASLPGLSVSPVAVPLVAEFAPVGNISSGTGNGARLFGDKLAEKMRARYPDVPAQPPQLASSLVAMYPVKGARKGQSMSLSALLMVDAGGRITEARVLPDEPVFVAAVLAALRNAAFKPAKLDGKPVPYWTVIDFRFDIDGPTGPDGKRLDR
jgi:hypothetical protein